MKQKDLPAEAEINVSGSEILHAFGIKGEANHVILSGNNIIIRFYKGVKTIARDV